MFGANKTPKENPTTAKNPWSLERVGHPHQNITIRHFDDIGVSQVFSDDKLVGHFAGTNSQQEARRHAWVTSSSSYKTKGNPNGDEYSRQF
jgi:hypothetical protein